MARLRDKMYCLSLLYKLLVFVVALLGLLDVGIALWFLKSNDWSIKPLSEWIVWLVEGVAWVLLSLSVSFNVRMQPYATILRIFWVATFLLGTYPTVSSTMDLMNGEVLFIERGLALVEWPICGMLLICAFLRKPSLRKASPEVPSSSEPLLGVLHDSKSNDNIGRPVDNLNECKRVHTTDFPTAGFFSRITFWWLNPLLSLGYKKPLEQSDLPSVGPDDQAKAAYEAFLEAWEGQKLQLRASKEPSIFWALVSCSWKDLTVNGIFALLKTVIISAGPLVLSTFIQYASGKHLFRYEGYVLAGGLLFAKLLESVTQRQWYFGSRRVGMRLRSALIGAMFQKQLRLSNAGRQNHAAGEILNYMTVDAYRIGEFPYWMHQIWSIPLQVVLAMAILFYSVGLATISGVSVIVLTTVINSPLAKLQQKFQTQLMHAQDERLRATTEAIQNMKILKLHAWEDEFKHAIDNLRKEEFKWLTAVQYRRTYASVIFWTSPVLVATATFCTCYFIGITLTASIVFTSLATLRIVQEPIRLVPDVITTIIQARVSLQRIARFLAEDELQPDAVDRGVKGDSPHAIEVEGASLSWDVHASKATLRNLKFKVGHGQKVAVCGEVGAGKSTLLCSLLGEVPRMCGKMRVRGSIAYVAQTAWIQSGTIRENVLFGREMERRRYEECLRVCALDKDVEGFPYGDLTEIGERGLNMSGGQKQRIQVARAVYQDADIYLMDDPFSAVDAHTAATLFKECVMGALPNKTIVLVTHQVEFLPVFDSILLLRDGEIREAGRYDELLQHGSAFEELVNAHLGTMNLATKINEKSGITVTNVTSEKLKKKLSKTKSMEETKQAHSEDQLTRAEERETGGSSIKVYMEYLRQNKGFLYYSVAIISHAVFLAAQIASNTWLAAKVNDPNTGALKLITVYSAIGISSIVLLLIRAISIVVMGLLASKSFFGVITSSLFRAPMAFFDSTPTGRILSRVAVDLSILDTDFPFSLVFAMTVMLNALAYSAVASIVTWPIFFAILLMFYANWWLQGYYMATCKELMRFNGTTKSPIANFFGEAISGAVTLRAFLVQDAFMMKNLHLIDRNSSPFFHTFAANEWLVQRLETLCAIVLFLIALTMVLLPSGTLKPGFVGLSLSYGLSLNISLILSVQNQCTLANNSISIERVKQYMHIPSEAPAIIEGSRPSPSWPALGKVELQMLQVRYRPDSPLVLKGVTCTFEGGHKVGVVGRTGSGKTTLISALFRLVEPAGGRILIDGLDIMTIGLHDLRSRLSVIPQEPTLFRGTVRFNLDPLSQYSDMNIWEVLGKCQLRTVVEEKKGKLYSTVEGEGANWSVGQRQLFCLGRALLKRSCILVLDEATASIDNATDSILQKTIREEFASCTVITVAHRIPTVVDSDMVLALSDGVLVEFDQPTRLLENKESLFAKLVAEYWSRSHNTFSNAS